MRSLARARTLQSKTNCIHKKKEQQQTATLYQIIFFIVYNFVFFFCKTFHYIWSLKLAAALIVPKSDEMSKLKMPLECNNFTFTQNSDYGCV